MDLGLYLGVVFPSLPLFFFGESLSDPEELLSFFFFNGEALPSLLSESLPLPLFSLSLDLRSPFTGDLLFDFDELFFLLSLDLRSPAGGERLLEELLSCLFLGGD